MERLKQCNNCKHLLDENCMQDLKDKGYCKCNHCKCKVYDE